MDGIQLDEEAIVSCGTTKGDIELHLIREWSPNGYDRAVELYERHFFDHSHFYRAVPKFLVQFGITYSEDKELKKFARTPIQDDPKHDPPIPFSPGIISYAGSGPNSRSSQMFISYGRAPSLGRELWETPIGKVTKGMDAAEGFYSYGDMPPWGKGPEQGRIHNGPQYIENNFPLIDKFLECTVKRLKPGAAAVTAAADDGDDQKVNEELDDMEQPEGKVIEGTDDEPMQDDKSEPETGVKTQPRRRGLRLPGKEKFFAKAQNIGSKFVSKQAGSQDVVFPIALILLLFVVALSCRGKRKNISKDQ